MLGAVMMPTGRIPLAILLAALLTVAGALAARAADDVPVGVRSFDVGVPERGAPVTVELWYPAAPGGTIEAYGASPLFVGVKAVRDAPVAAGRFPLVLLAHGGLRSNPSLAGWIAARLAGAGRIVVSVHPPALGPRQAGEAVDEFRLRPADLRAALSAAEALPEVAAHRVPGKVGAVGFFLGGTSVLALAGARFDVGHLRAACDTPARGPDCRWFAASGIDLHRAVDEAFGTDRTDPRIGAMVAVDPELMDAFDPASLAAIAVPVTLLRLAADSPSPQPALIPGAHAETIADADAFTAFGACTGRAAAILKQEGEDEAICREGARPRAVLQAEIAARIEEGLARGAGAP
ncbi:hypothetical protein NVS89_21080 [Ancylobacter sp. MQZ15Z-1]|uniref:Dienelactone hydrolase n=1 Tax=Ancylobacter mangrovi TaxID=2972472 RepID=A0A9X2T8X0_9HYPH|nr:hypothetical protein [Ancylobacter mangrovi]MCS0497588.1 hypothetical protein [Ancylobacter mangrovi]